MRSHIQRLAEHTGKMKFTQSRLLRQVGQGQRLIEMSVDPGQYVTFHPWRQSSCDRGQAPLHCGIVLDQMGEQQTAGGAKGQLVRRLSPVISQQKLTIHAGDFVIAGEGFFLQGEVSRAAIPHFLPNAAQMRIGTIEMDKRQIAADIPDAFIAFRHQAKAIRAAAILPAVRRLLIAFITIGDVQA